MKIVAAILGSVTGVGVLAALAFVLSAPPQESPHDKDLRDCRGRYAASPYAPADHRLYHAELVDACMRGRGY